MRFEKRGLFSRTAKGIPGAFRSRPSLLEEYAMRLRVISMIFLLCVTSTSCISNFRVKKGSTKLAGIPFYVKQARPRSGTLAETP